MRKRKMSQEVNNKKNKMIKNQQRKDRNKFITTSILFLLKRYMNYTKSAILPYCTAKENSPQLELNYKYQMVYTRDQPSQKLQ
jgi:hypothetical protein